MGTTAYIGSCAGKFYAFDLPTGKVVWSYDVKPDGAEQFHGAPVVDDSTITVGTDMGTERRGTLYALDRSTGSLRWKLPADPGLPSDLVVHGRLACATQSYSDDLIAVRLDDGQVAWRFTPPTPDADSEAAGPPRLRSNPLLVDDTVVFATRDNTLFAIGADAGKPVWSRRLADGVTTDFCHVDGGIALGVAAMGIVVLDPSDGSTVRSFGLDLIPLATMLYRPPLLIFLGSPSGDRPREVVALDLASGSVEWRQSLDDADPEAYWYVPRIHAWNNAVVVGSTHGLLAAYDADIGEPLWTCQLKGAIRGIGHAGDILLVGTFEGSLYALRFR